MGLLFFFCSFSFSFFISCCSIPLILLSAVCCAANHSINRSAASNTVKKRARLNVVALRGRGKGEDKIELEGKKEKGGVLGSNVKFGGQGLAYTDHGRNVHIYLHSRDVTAGLHFLRLMLSFFGVLP